MIFLKTIISHSKERRKIIRSEKLIKKCACLAVVESLRILCASGKAGNNKTG